MPSILLNPSLPGVCQIFRVPHLPASDGSHAEHAKDFIENAQSDINDATHYANSMKDGHLVLSELSSADCDLIEAICAAEKAAQAIIDLQNYASFWRRLAIKIANESGQSIQLLYFAYESFKDEE